MQTLILISIYFTFSLQFCVQLKVHGSMVMVSELTFEKAAGGWPIAQVKVCLVFKTEVGIDLEAVLHNNTKNYTYEAVG